MPIKAIIVDDEEVARLSLKALLESYTDISVKAMASGADEALLHFINHKPDLIFLDVEMPCKSGFDLVKELQKHHFKSIIIFVTAYDKYAIEAIRHAAFDFLLKPINPEELANAIARSRETLNENNLSSKIDLLFEKLNNHRKIRFNTRTGYILIDPGEVVYCAADGNYTWFYFGGGRKEIVCSKIGEVIDLLPEHFIRAGRSNIINQNLITKVDRVNKKVELVFKGEKFAVDAIIK